MNKCYLFKLILPCKVANRNSLFTVVLTNNNVIFSLQILISVFKYEYNSPEDLKCVVYWL